MTLDRRNVLSAGIAAGVTIGAAAGPRPAAAHSPARGDAYGVQLAHGSDADQAPALQAAIDAAATQGAPLRLPPGRFRCGPLQLRAGTRLIGADSATTLAFAGGGSFITAESADNILLDGLVLDGGDQPLDGDVADGLVALRKVRRLRITGLSIVRSALNGISLTACAGSVSDCSISGAMQAAIHSVDSAGVDITHNDIADCSNAGIRIWRSEPGEDGSTVCGNRIARIRADAGGTGENGNGVNVFRAGGVLVSANRITDCAYTAVRGNAASDIQIIGNSCARLGEVAIYAEFGFQGALIANNLIDTAATGISVTNFNDGGRLAVVQGNLVRNLFRREHESEDKRGHGITVEADSALSGNVVENAPTAGIVIGWGPFMRDVVATGNLVRASRVGILVSSDADAGACLLANNLISRASEGAIRAMDGSGAPVGPDLAPAGAGGPISATGNLAV